MKPVLPVRLSRTLCTLACVVLAATCAVPAVAQDEPGGSPRAEKRDGPWFGLLLPPAVGEAPAVVVGTRMPRPVRVPAVAPAGNEFSSAVLRADLTTIVGFSQESRRTKEIGSGQQWGRISGFASGAKTVEWARASTSAAATAISSSSCSTALPRLGPATS